LVQAGAVVACARNPIASLISVSVGIDRRLRNTTFEPVKELMSRICP
jgi:hypothetical protein